MQNHQSDPRTLSRRTLAADHRGLAALVRPGMSVLDVGCGTGAITRGIADAVGPRGHVVGVDRDESLLDIARSKNNDIPWLRFEQGDALQLPFRRQFDIVTAARTLQWVADPAAAVRNLRDAAKPGGAVVILDYDHLDNTFHPDPPESFAVFYKAFLAWRDAHSWDNRMASHLPDLLKAAGLTDVASEDQSEIAHTGQADFPERSTLWIEVMEKLGDRVVADGFCTSSQLADALREYTAWARTELLTQTLAMRTVTGFAPAGDPL